MKMSNVVKEPITKQSKAPFTNMSNGVEQTVRDVQAKAFRKGFSKEEAKRRKQLRDKARMTKLRKEGAAQKETDKACFARFDKILSRKRKKLVNILSENDKLRIEIDLLKKEMEKNIEN